MNDGLANPHQFSPQADRHYFGMIENGHPAIMELQAIIILDTFSSLDISSMGNHVSLPCGICFASFHRLHSEFAVSNIKMGGIQYFSVIHKGIRGIVFPRPVFMKRCVSMRTTSFLNKNMALAVISCSDLCSFEGQFSKLISV